MKLKFGNSDSKNWQLFGMIATILLLIRLFFFDNVPIQILKYNGGFYFALCAIFLGAIIVTFLQARETYLTDNRHKLIKIYKSVVSFIIGGILVAIYTNLVFISALDRIILKYPATEKTENIKIVSKQIYYSHGNPSYSITVKSAKLDIETDFKVSGNKYDNYKISNFIKVEYSVTKNGTIYLSKDENSLEL